MTTVAMDGSLHGGQVVGPLVMQREVDVGGDGVDMPRGACEQKRAGALQGEGGRQKPREKQVEERDAVSASSRPPTKPRSTSAPSSTHPPLPALAHREAAAAPMMTGQADEEDEDALDDATSHPSQAFYRSRGSTAGSSAGSDVLVADGETSVSGGDSSRQQGNSDFIIREGWLHRRGQVIKSWSRQYFVLFETELFWFADDAKRHKKGSIKILPETQLEEANFRLNCFCLVTGSRRLCLAASDNTEKLVWMELLGAAINMAREIKRDSLLQSWRVFDSVPSADEKVSSIMSHRRDRAKVLVKVGSARGLLGKDRSGMSSPYAVVKLGRTVVKTQVKRRTLEPSWGEIFIFDYDRSIRQAMIEVFDWDNFSRDRFLGRVVIPLYLAYNTPMDRWFALGKRSIKSRVCGEIQLRVVLMAQPDFPAETSMRYLQSLEDLRIPLLTPSAPSYTDLTTDTAQSGEAASGTLWLPLPHTERLEDISYAVELTSSAFGGSVSIQGQLLLTNYRLVFLSDRKRMVKSTHTGQHTQVPEVMTEVPIRLIATVKVMKGATMALKVRCKDARKLVFAFLSVSSTSPPTQPPSPPQEPVTPVGSRGSGALVVASGAYAGIPGLVPPSVAGGAASHSMSLGGAVAPAPYHVRGAHGSMSGGLLATLSQTVTRARSGSIASTTQQHIRKSSGQSTATSRTRSSSGSVSQVPRR